MSLSGLKYGVVGDYKDQRIIAWQLDYDCMHFMESEVIRFNPFFKVYDFDNDTLNFSVKGDDYSMFYPDAWLCYEFASGGMFSISRTDGFKNFKQAF